MKSLPDDGRKTDDPQEAAYPLSLVTKGLTGQLDAARAERLRALLDELTSGGELLPWIPEPRPRRRRRTRPPWQVLLLGWRQTLSGQHSGIAIILILAAVAMLGIWQWKSTADRLRALEHHLEEIQKNGPSGLVPRQFPNATVAAPPAPDQSLPHAPGIPVPALSEVARPPAEVPKDFPELPRLLFVDNEPFGVELIGIEATTKSGPSLRFKQVVGPDGARLGSFEVGDIIRRVERRKVIDVEQFGDLIEQNADQLRKSGIWIEFEDGKSHSMYRAKVQLVPDAASK